MAGGNGRSSKYLLLALGMVLLAVSGYSGYVLYPRFDLPPVAGVGLLALAAMAGMAALFSPCSFPLLVTLLAREVKDGHGRSRLFRFAIAFTLGAMLFLLLTGTAIALGAGALFARVTFTSMTGRALRTIVGLVLIAFGVWQVSGRSLSFAWFNRLWQPFWNAQAHLRHRRSTLSMGLYGFGYVLAGFG